MPSIYLTFSRGQRIGIISLIILNLLALLSYFFLPYLIYDEMTPNDKEIQDILSHVMMDTLPSKLLHPFPFNPNTLDESGFQRLGLTEKLSQTIIHYRNKGGYFYQPESFRRIWGLKEEDYRALLPFIRIEKEKSLRETANIPDLNTCDTAALIMLPGIGSTLASNIVAYRRLLGGFAHLSQLKEVWGIREETYLKILPHLRVNAKNIRKININMATWDDLKQHPYLRGEVALTIVNYRKSVHYHIAQIEELKSQPLINAELFRKIAPYISTR